MPIPSSVCVYCGAAENVPQIYKDAASALGRLFGERGIRLVYGGGRVGLMGLVADAAVAAGGEVIGVIPRHLLEWEVAHQALTELVVVDTMHERKRAMADRSQAFVVMPGGLGTLDEAFEILTWKQLGLHDLPIIILNVDGYWNKLLDLIGHAVSAGFVRSQDMRLFREVATVAEVLPALAGEPPGAVSASDLM